MHDRRARYVDNHDGDTVTVLLDQDFFDFKQVNLRLANVWAPELNEPGGLEVMNYVRTWAHSYNIGKWPFLVLVHRLRSDREAMTLGRYVADVMTIDGAHSLNADVMKFISDRGFTGGTGSIARTPSSKDK